MSNMSYCRFQNTSIDLQDCIDAVGEMIDGGYDLDDHEQQAFQRLVKQAAELLSLVGDAVGMEVEELCHKIEWEGDSLIEDFRDSCGDAEDRAGDEEADAYYATAWAHGLISSRIAAGSVTEAYDAAKRFGKTWSSESRTDIEDDWGLNLTDVSRADCRAALFAAGFEVAFDNGHDDDWVIWHRAK